MILRWLNPVMAYVAGGALILGTLGGALAGWRVRDWKCDAAQADAIRAATAAQRKVQDRLTVTLEELERQRALSQTHTIETRNTIREIYRDKVISPDCAAPASARGLLTSERNRANAAASGQPVPAVPADTGSPRPAN